MQLFVLGAPCSGKSTVAALLRRRGVAAIDVDEEIQRLNGGVWPDIDTKNDRLLPLVLDAAARLSEVVLLNSYMPVDRTRRLRSGGFSVVLLEVSEDELRRRDRERLRVEGWSNAEWFEWNQSVIEEHRQLSLIDSVIGGEQDPDAVAATVIALLRPRDSS